MTPWPQTSASPAPACVMVIFGAGGDLARRLLFPSLYHLVAAGLLSPGFKVLGVDLKAGDDESFRSDVVSSLQEISSTSGSKAVDPAALTWLRERLFYQAADFGVDDSYRALGARIAQLAGEGASALFYLAVAPRFFGEIVERLSTAGLTREPDGAFRRAVVEKPFGSDLASAKALNERILQCLEEAQVYRIDHFLGKETVRNIIVTRFANGVFEPLWNRLHIDHVQITAAETVGVELRGGFYDRTGALRDMVPNHLLHLLAMIAMEAPNTFDAAEIAAERARVIRAIRRLTPQEALANSVRGQYRAGVVDGHQVADYRREPNVAPDSRTETYVALKLMIDNWRWGGVPFYLRTGKAMNVRDTHVAISFKQAPTLLFEDQPPNSLVLQIQPREGVSLQFEVKRPGPEVQLQPVTMDFCYSDYFKATPSTGYETLIHDALIGDRTRFKSADEILFGWAAVQPFLDAWAGGGSGGEVQDYAAGSQGPALADALLASDGRAWRSLAP
jgi:glucose-6-phosphate 1-dehydrogenase